MLTETCQFLESTTFIFSFTEFLFFSTIPPVQFNSAGGGRTHIGQPNPALSDDHYYEDPDKIRNDIRRGFADNGKQ
jgi:hypothetical protein